MTHLLAAIATDAEHMPALLYSMRNVLVVPDLAIGPDGEDAEAWGVGYYQDDHALTIRKPGELLASRSMYELAREVRSQIIIAAVSPTASAVQAPPFRFRRWLYGTAGELAVFEQFREKIQDAVPDFIRTDVADAGGEKLAFGMFLREMQDAGILGESLPDPVAVAHALRRSVSAMKMLAQKAGLPVPVGSIVASNGRMVLATRASGPAIHYRRQEGLELGPDGPLPRRLGDPQQMAGALKRFRAVVVCAEMVQPPSGWIEVRDGETVVIDRQLSVQVLTDEAPR